MIDRAVLSIAICWFHMNIIESPQGVIIRSLSVVGLGVVSQETSKVTLLVYAVQYLPKIMLILFGVT